MPIDMRAVARAHAFMRVECPPAPWPADSEDEPFFKLLGEMIATGLVRDGGVLAELTLNIANVVVDPEAANPLPEGEFVAVSVSGEGDWRPESVWRPDIALFVTRDLTVAAHAAGIRSGYSRVLSTTRGSVTVLLPRA